MANLNKVILMGNLVSDPEVRDLNKGGKVASFTIACTERYRVGEETREDTAYLECEAFGKNADTIGTYFKKGRPIFVEGRLKQDKWKDKDSGQNRSKIVVKVDQFQFVNSVKDTEGQDRESKPTPPSIRVGKDGKVPTPKKQEVITNDQDDDTPF